MGTNNLKLVTKDTRPPTMEERMEAYRMAADGIGPEDDEDHPRLTIWDVVRESMTLICVAIIVTGLLMLARWIFA